MVPQADKLFYNSFKEGQGPMLYMRDTATGKTTKVSGRKGLNTGAAFPPHQRYLALTLTEGDNMDIYAIDFAGNIVRRLTSVWASMFLPRSLQTGQRWLMSQTVPALPRFTFRMWKMGGRRESPSREVQHLTLLVEFESDCLCRAGRQPVRDLYDQPQWGGLRKITGNNGNHGNNEDPCWYANGRYLVFSSSRDGGYHIYLAMANGFNPRKVNISMKGEQTCPSWSP